MQRLLAKSEEERQKGPANGKSEECSAGSNNMIRRHVVDNAAGVVGIKCSSALAVAGGPHSERGHSWREASTPAAVYALLPISSEGACMYSVLHTRLENPVTQPRFPCHHSLCRLLAQPSRPPPRCLPPGCMPHIKIKQERQTWPSRYCPQQR